MESWWIPCDKIFEDKQVETKTLGINYLTACEPEVQLKIPLKNTSISISQNISLGVGGVVWDCARALLSFIIDFPYVCKNKKILELGSGTGVVGIGAAILDAKNVILSDLEEILPLIKRNYDKTCKAIHENITIVEYRWGSKLLPEMHDIEVVFSSDSLYDPKCFDDFRKSLDMILKKKAIMYLSYKRRIPEHEVSFFRDLTKTYDVTVFSKDSFNAFCYHEDVWIFKFAVK